MEDNMFPRNLYKSPGSIKGNYGRTYDTILVGDENEYKVALEEGWIDGFAKAFEQVSSADAEETGASEDVAEEAHEAQGPEVPSISFDAEDF